MHYIKQILLPLILLSSVTASAVIPEIEIWEQEATQESQTTDRRYRYLLKDVHLDFKGAKNTIQQQEDILWILQQNKDTTFAIIEDSSSLSRKFKMQYQLETEGTSNLRFPSNLQEEINSRNLRVCHFPTNTTEEQTLYHVSPLELLDHFCQRADIKTYNVECNTIINAYRNFFTYQNEQEHQQIQQLVHDVLYDHTNDLKEVESPYCKVLYQRHADLASMIGKSDKETFVSAARTVRCILLEARMYHQLEAQQSIKNGYVITGAEHIECIKQNLPALGYKYIKTIGIPPVRYITEVVDEEKKVSKIKEVIATPFNTLVRNPLDLRKVFTQIFDEQKLGLKK